MPKQPDPTSQDRIRLDKILSGLNKHILWDVDIERFDPFKYKEFLAERIATKGNLSDLRWYFSHFGKETFIYHVQQARSCPQHIKQFWQEF